MQVSLPLFIYLDSKIIGSALQICAFFECGIFDKNNITILIKKYKHKSNKIIANIFSKENIHYRFVSADDMDKLAEGVIFYPFNAQSNCRAVANRKLTHIFITHGESNKVSSIKPIIRIYDYVITAGQAGIDRYLANGIFSQYDVDTGRIIPLGNTFIGKTGLAPKGVGQAVIFYAPTWEGGIEQENYSSLSYTQLVAKSLVDTATIYQTNTIVIKPHPNTGHRTKAYINHIYELTRQLKNEQLQVVIFRPYLKTNWIQLLKYKNLDITFVDNLTDYYAVVGFCDVSAVETQFLNEDIPYYLFCYTKYKMVLQKKHEYYKNSLIEFCSEVKINMLMTPDFLQLKKSVIFQKLNGIALSERIPFLLTNLKMR